MRSDITVVPKNGRQRGPVRKVRAMISDLNFKRPDRLQENPVRELPEVSLVRFRTAFTREWLRLRQGK